MKLGTHEAGAEEVHILLITCYGGSPLSSARFVVCLF